jgi:hypothetical protein
MHFVLRRGACGIGLTGGAVRIRANRGRRADRPVAEVAADVRISLQTIYTSRCQDRIDWGLEPGLRSGEHAGAGRRITPGYR